MPPQSKFLCMAFSFPSSVLSKLFIVDGHHKITPKSSSLFILFFLRCLFKNSFPWKIHLHLVLSIFPSYTFPMLPVEGSVALWGGPKQTLLHVTSFHVSRTFCLCLITAWFSHVSSSLSTLILFFIYSPLKSSSEEVHSVVREPYILFCCL